MPKRRPDSGSSDHLSAALDSLRKRPHPEVGLAADDSLATVSYVLGVGVGSEVVAVLAKSGKCRVGFHLTVELAERARNSVWHLAEKTGLTLSGLAEKALALEVERLEQAYNDGRPFPPRRGSLRGRARRRSR